MKIKLRIIRDNVLRGEAKVGEWVCMILEEAHCSTYSTHPGVGKNVSWSKAALLEVWDEEGYFRVCGQVFVLPTGVT